LCKKYTYNINHCAGTKKKSKKILHVEHCIASVSNLMPHLTCCGYLVLALQSNYLKDAWADQKKLPPSSQPKKTYVELCLFTSIF
jgi:hypothetical protein